MSTFDLKSPSVTNIPHNYSNDEIAAIIEVEYPNLQGPLKAMFDRFKKFEYPEGFGGTTESHRCSHCGTDIEIKVNDQF